MLNNDSEFVKWFRSAAPYIHAHRGKTVVLQFEGDLIDSKEFSHLVHDIALLNSLGIRLVIVFGARPQIEKLQEQRNIESHIVRGLRFTEEASITCVKEAVGAARIKIEALLSMGLPNSPMEDAQVKVTSGNFITAKPIGVIDGVDLGFTGEIRRVDTETMIRKLDNNEIVLLSPIGYSPTGEVFNLRATEVAMKVAISLEADKLLYFMSGEGLKDKEGEDIHQLTQQEAESRIECSSLSDSAQLQLSCGIRACNEGVKRVHFLQQDQDGSLLLELFSRDGVGTLLSTASFDQIRIASVDDVGGILQLIEPLEQEGILVRRSRGKIEADIGVLESDLRALELGRPALVYIPALDLTVPAAVDVISPRIDPESRTCQVLVRLRSDDGKIKPGMFVRTSIAGEVYPDKLVVPREAILTRDGRSIDPLPFLRGTAPSRAASH